VLSNFICDAASLVTPDRLLDSADNEMIHHVQTLFTFCQNNPSVRVVVVPPLARSVPAWFNPYLPCFTTNLFSHVSKFGSTQLRYLAPFITPAQFFDVDGVHLNQDAALQFLQFILSGVDQVFPPTETLQASYPTASLSSVQHVQPIQMLPSRLDQPSTSTSVSGLPPDTPTPAAPLHSSNLAVEFGRVSSALATLTSLTSSMKAETQVRREQDNLIFARLKEDRDFELNKNRENRFTLTGFTSPGVPRDARERKDFFKLKLQALVDEACPETLPRPEVIDVYVNMRPGQDSPFLEGRMDSAASSSAFRTAASQLIKDESPNFRNLFVANAVTLSTRVRIEILRAISKVLSSDHTESFVQGFSSRPLLHYRTLEHVQYHVEGANRSYSFVEAVAKFGHLVPQYSLVSAYRRARPAFTGCLEQYFVILKESGPGDYNVTSGSNLVPLGQGSSGSFGRGQQIRGRGSRSRPRGTSRGRGFRSAPNVNAGASISAISSESRKRLPDHNPLESTPSKRAITETQTPSEAMVTDQGGDVMD